MWRRSLRRQGFQGSGNGQNLFRFGKPKTGNLVSVKGDRHAGAPETVRRTQARRLTRKASAVTVGTAYRIGERLIGPVVVETCPSGERGGCYAIGKGESAAGREERGGQIRSRGFLGRSRDRDAADLVLLRRLTVAPERVRAGGPESARRTRGGAVSLPGSEPWSTGLEELCRGRVF